MSQFDKGSHLGAATISLVVAIVLVLVSFGILEADLNSLALGLFLISAYRFFKFWSAK